MCKVLAKCRCEMNDLPNSATSISLLQRLSQNPQDHTSWQQFVLRYGARIHWWCRGWGLQEADAEDVTQNVLVKIAKHMGKFEYRQSGRFRSWLRTVTYHALCDYLEIRKRLQERSGSDAVYRQLESAEAKDQLLDTMDAECEQQLLEDAMEIVRGRVEETTWQAFVEVALRHRKADDVATELGIKTGTVYVAKSRVKQMLATTVKELDSTTEC